MRNKIFLNANTTALEQEIDKLVYQLYGLSVDEIAIVEGKNNSVPLRALSGEKKQLTTAQHPSEEDTEEDRE